MNFVIILFGVLLHRVFCENENPTENTVTKIDEEDIEDVTEITTLDPKTEESTVEMYENPLNSSEPIISKTELDQKSANPITVDKEFTSVPPITESVTDLSDPVKQNILKMFNNLLESDVANVRETTTDNMDTDEVTRTVTTPMTTPSSKKATTTKSAITNSITMTTQYIPKDTIKTSTDITTEELTTLSTLYDKIATTIQAEKIDTKPTTIETIPTTPPSTIKQFKIGTTTLGSTMLDLTEQETTDRPDTTTQNINTDNTQTTTQNLISNTTNTMLSGTTSQTRKQAASEIQETTENLSTSVPTEIVNMSTTIVTSTEPILKALVEEMVETEEMTSMRSTANIESDEVSSKKAAEEGSTTTEETSEETTTEWFYPTTKPGRSSLYSIAQELPFRNPDNSVPTLILHGAHSKTSQTNFPWIFPKWISNKELSNPNQKPRLIQF